MAAFTRSYLDTRDSIVRACAVEFVSFRPSRTGVAAIAKFLAAVFKFFAVIFKPLAATGASAREFESLSSIIFRVDGKERRKAVPRCIHSGAYEKSR